MANFLDIIKGDGPAVQFIKSVVTSGIPGSQILSQLRASGLGISNATGYQVINYLRDNYLPAQFSLQTLANDLFPNINDIPKSVTTLLRNFSYKVAVTGTDVNTGEQITQHIQLSTNQLLTKDQAKQVAAGIIESGAGNYGMAYESAEVVDIMQNNSGVTNVSPAQLPVNQSFKPTPTQIINQSAVYLPYGYDSWSQYYTDIHS